MNPSKVLLITLVGPYGEVDVAVRADLPAAELLPAFNELVGRGGKRRQQAQSGGNEPQSSGARTPSPGQRPQYADQGFQDPGQGSQGPGQRSQEPAPGGGRHRQGAAQPQPPSPAAPDSPQYPSPQSPASAGQGGAPASASQGGAPASTSHGGGRRRGVRESPAAEPSRQDIPLQGTLADAGIVDGTVLYLYRASEKTEASR